MSHCAQLYVLGLKGISARKFPSPWHQLLLLQTWDEITVRVPLTMTHCTDRKPEVQSTLENFKGDWGIDERIVLKLSLEKIGCEIWIDSEWDSVNLVYREFLSWVIISSCTIELVYLPEYKIKYLSWFIIWRMTGHLMIVCKLQWNQGEGGGSMVLWNTCILSHH
jgi:hypothetical protein